MEFVVSWVTFMQINNVIEPGSIKFHLMYIGNLGLLLGLKLWNYGTVFTSFSSLFVKCIEMYV